MPSLEDGLASPLLPMKNKGDIEPTGDDDEDVYKDNSKPISEHLYTKSIPNKEVSSETLSKQKT
jgi:hypothetical protein